MHPAAPARVPAHTSALSPAGGGHFSPVGGYHEPSDSALVLDVARFKYPPYWVPLPALWEASLAVDDVTGLARGWFILRGSEAGLPPGKPRRD